MIRVIEIGCRDFLMAGKALVPVDDITGVDLSPEDDGRTVVIATRKNEVVLYGGVAEAFRAFVNK